MVNERREMSTKVSKKLSRREELELWREKKGKTKKESCHPLLSRKRSLAKVVASPSYKPPPKREKVNDENKVAVSKASIRRKTLDWKELKNIENKIKVVDRRKTLTVHTLNRINNVDNVTPWKDKSRKLQERLDIWRDHKNTKKPSHIPIPLHSQNTKTKSSKTDFRKSYPKSPFPVKTIKNNTAHSTHIISSTDNVTHDRKHQNEQQDNLECDVHDVIQSNHLSSISDVNSPNNRLDDSLVNMEPSSPYSPAQDRLALFAITPGRKVHFPITVDSPISQMKSTAIKYCVMENKQKKRVSFEPKTKLMTPVRRSMRLSTSYIPDFLKDSNHRIIDSPGEMEDQIIDGEISFRANKALNTPLNNGWFIDNEDDHVDSDEDVNEVAVEGDLDVSFM